MADESASAPANFAEYEAGGSTYAPPAEPAVEAAPQEDTTESEASDEQAETAAEPEAADVTTQEPAKAPKAKRTLNEEHSSKLKQLIDMRREVRELEAKKRGLEQGASNGQAAPQAAPVKPEPLGPKPRLSTWTGPLEGLEDAQEEWDKKHIANLRADVLHEFEEREQKRQVEESQKRVKDDYGKQLIEHVKAHPEYDEEIGKTPVSPLMYEIVLRNGPYLAQALIDNRDEAWRIYNLPNDAQLFEMGKLAGRAKNGNGAKPTPEAAEEPPQPVKVPAQLNAAGGTNAALSRPDLGAKNFAQFEAISERLARKGKK